MVKPFAVLLQIPHASLRLPSSFEKGCLLEASKLERYNVLMTDWGVDHLFETALFPTIKARYSRLFVDMERYEDEAQEPMAIYGQGMVYTRVYDGTPLRSPSLRYRARVAQFYHHYHQCLNDCAHRLYESHQGLLLLDCHSFSEEVASFLQPGPYPDVCLGTVPGFSSLLLTKFFVSTFENAGYRVALNKPYSGSLIPSVFTSGEPLKYPFVSIMIEINKRTYATPEGLIKLRQTLVQMFSVLKKVAAEASLNALLDDPLPGISSSKWLSRLDQLLIAHGREPCKRVSGQGAFAFIRLLGPPPMK